MNFRARPKLRRVPKTIGGDVELANFMTGLPADYALDVNAVSARLILAAVPGVVTAIPSVHASVRAAAGQQVFPVGALDEDTPGFDTTQRGLQYYHPVDWGRLFLGNGGSCYIDADHPEICVPECASALDHLTWTRAGLEICRRAMLAANAGLAAEGGGRIRLLANNSDGRGNSYGSHINICVTDECWSAVCLKNGPAAAFTASAFAVLAALFGQGKAGHEAYGAPCKYQLSQRADFFNVTREFSTQWPNRGLINTRQEPHAAARHGVERMHIIPFDFTLSQSAHLMKTGLLQLLFALIESCAPLPEALILRDPVHAFQRFSRDVALKAAVPAQSGSETGIIEWFERFLDLLAGWKEGFEDTVPGAGSILMHARWLSEALRARDHSGLAAHLDGWSKLGLLKSAMACDPALDWSSPEIKALDHLYASLDEEGLYLQMERADKGMTFFTEADLDAAIRQPPKNTRAALRARLIRVIPADHLRSLDWGEVIFDLDPGGRPVRLAMPPPWAPGLDTPAGRAGDYSKLCAAVNAGASFEPHHHHEPDTTDTHRTDHPRPATLR